MNNNTVQLQVSQGLVFYKGYELEPSTYARHIIFAETHDGLTFEYRNNKKNGKHVVVRKKDADLFLRSHWLHDDGDYELNDKRRYFTSPLHEETDERRIMMRNRKLSPNLLKQCGENNRVRVIHSIDDLSRAPNGARVRRFVSDGTTKPDQDQPIAQQVTGVIEGGTYVITYSDILHGPQESERRIERIDLRPDADLKVVGEVLDGIILDTDRSGAPRTQMAAALSDAVVVATAE